MKSIFDKEVEDPKFKTIYEKTSLELSIEEDRAKTEEAR